MELLQALLEWAAAARLDSDPGGPTVQVYEDVESHSTFALHAEWRSVPALDAHVSSDPFGVLLGALQLLAQSVQISVGGETVEYGSDPLSVIRRLRETAGASANR